GRLTGEPAGLEADRTGAEPAVVDHGLGFVHGISACIIHCRATPRSFGRRTTARGAKPVIDRSPREPPGSHYRGPASLVPVGAMPCPLSCYSWALLFMGKANRMRAHSQLSPVYRGGATRRSLPLGHCHRRRPSRWMIERYRSMSTFIT